MLKSIFYQKTIKNIPIQKCIHYRGYRYGLFTQNIYEDYIYDLHLKNDLIKYRKKFLYRIIANVAFNFSEVLQIKLKKNYIPFYYPWSFKSINEYELSAINNPDIICHSSKEGILISHINREFYWLDRAYNTIKNNGYNPRKFGYIRVLELRRSKEDIRYIVTDGNHRISSLSVLGESHVKAVILKNPMLHRNLSNIWPQVVLGNFNMHDALSIFDRYFIEENMPLAESDNLSCLIFDEQLNYSKIYKK